MKHKKKLLKALTVTALAALLVVLCLGWSVRHAMGRQQLSGELVNAAKRGDYAAAETLLAKGADPNAIPRLDMARLSWKDKIRVVLNLRMPDETPRDARPALFWAAARGHADIVRLLLERGADVSQTDQYERTVIVEAAGWGRVDILTLLCAHGANPNGGSKTMQGPVYVWTPLVMAAMMGKADALKFLLEHGADPNLSHGNKANDTLAPLQWAVLKDNPACVRVLLAHGANPNYKTANGTTAMHLARYQNNKALVQMLVQAGAK